LRASPELKEDVSSFQRFAAARVLKEDASSFQRAHPVRPRLLRSARNDNEKGVCLLFDTSLRLVSMTKKFGICDLVLVCILVFVI